MGLGWIVGWGHVSHMIVADHSLHIGLLVGPHRSEARALLHWSQGLQSRGHQVTLFRPSPSSLPSALFDHLPDSTIHTYTDDQTVLDLVEHVHRSHPMHILLAPPRPDLASWIHPPHTPLWMVTEPALIGSPYREWMVGHQVLPVWLRELSEDWTPALSLGERLFRQWTYYWQG